VARDLVFLPGVVSNVELAWDEPHWARFYEQLASFSRLIVFDRRGIGLSDRLEGARPRPSRSAWRSCPGRARRRRLRARGPVRLARRGGDVCAVRGEIPGAVYEELPGADIVPWLGESDGIIDSVERFLEGVRDASSWEEADRDRVLATVLFTDIVDSTAKAAELGDARWRELLGTHHDLVRRQLIRFRGREIDTAGDGFSPASTARLARFGAPRP